MLLHNNALTHSAIFVRQFLDQKIVVVFDHPLCASDQAPPDLFPLSRVRADIKGARFADVNAIKELVTVVQRSIPQEALLIVSESCTKVVKRVLKRIVTILKNNKENLFVSFVLLVF